jgi:signal transduction histidine kinase
MEKAAERGTDLRRSERTMILARWIAVPWTLFQVLSYSDKPYPSGFRNIGLGLVALIAAGNLIIMLFHSRAASPQAIEALALGSLIFDGVAIAGFVWLYTFDQNAALWAIIFILPLAGATRFQLTGAMGAWLGGTVLYSAREIWGSDRFDYPLQWNSISFRMGIGFIIALVAGMMARDLVHQRSRLHHTLEELQRVDNLRVGLISTLAHDVRNPLTVIRGTNQILMMEGETIPPQKTVELLEVADRQAERLQRLATDLLDLARLEQGMLQLHLQDVFVKDAISSAVGFVAPEDKVVIDVDPSLRVRADPQRLEQIVVNLLSNAVRYGKAPYLVGAEAFDGKVTLEFRDHGPGIPPEDRTGLFQPFRAHDHQGSVGFGLAIVKALAEAQNGDVFYAANGSEGACFKVALPSADAS